MSALCFVLMYLSSLTEVLDLCAMVACSVLIIICVIETGKIYPWLIWAVTGILCMLFIPKKDIALEFVMFGGIYPMIKSYAEKLPLVFAWIAKLVFFNAAFTAWFFIATSLFTPDVGLKLGPVAYAVANVFFIVADVAFTLTVSLYMAKIRPRIAKGQKK